MWCANLQQVPPKNPQNRDYDCWVFFLGLDADTAVEKEIRSKHQKIDAILTAQNVNYAEITTFQGKNGVYEKFSSRERKHPLFFVFSKYPLQYSKEDAFLLIEWGKWADIESLKNDLMAFVNFFSDSDFRNRIAKAKDNNTWFQVLEFLKKHGVDLIKMGAAILAAVA